MELSSGGLLDMIKVVLTLLGGSLIWEDYYCLQFPGENGIIAFKLRDKQAHQQISNKVYFTLMLVISFFHLLIVYCII